MPAVRTLLVLSAMLLGPACGDEGAGGAGSPVGDAAPVGAPAGGGGADRPTAASPETDSAPTAPAPAPRDAPAAPAYDTSSVELPSGRVAWAPPGDAVHEEGRAAPHRPMEALLNGGFELVADTTTDPPKYGAYWKGAFTYAPGVPDDLVEESAAAAGGSRGLWLADGRGPVVQKIVADPRWTDELVVTLAVTARAGGRLRVVLEDGPGRVVSAVVEGGPEPEWRVHELALGRRFVEEHGERPVPRMNLFLAYEPPEGGPSSQASVAVDEVSAVVPMPDVTPEDLARTVAAEVRDVLHVWFDTVEEGGLGVVDPETGYPRALAFDVETGEFQGTASTLTYHAVHKVLEDWLELARRAGWEDEVAHWTPHMRPIVRSLLANNFDPDTGLPRMVLRDGTALDDSVVVGSYVNFLDAARRVVDDPELEAACVDQIRRTADALLRLQAAHDLPPQQVPNVTKLDRRTGVFEGRFPNWYGHIPNKLTPSGEIDTPRQYNTAWAIVTGRSFWYHLFKSPSAVMAAWALRPREGDLAGVQRALDRYDRPWDAALYDLENDTDDHYGYLCQDLLTLLGRAGTAMPRAMELLQIGTDHRLSRATGDVDDTIWIQAVRLGTACAGDSPRAIKGVLGIYQLPPEVNPVSSGLPLYRDALVELARNDWKGRQLTTGDFTQAFFQHWEMVCICFKGTYQGDCRERPLSEWDGDVGDIFGGPSISAVHAQASAYAVADEAERRDILSRLATLDYVTRTNLGRRYGLLAKVPEEVGRQYELPEKYVTGQTRTSAIGVVYVHSWLDMLPLLLGLEGGGAGDR